MVEIDLESIPILSMDNKIKRTIKESDFDVLYADGKIYYDTENGKTASGKILSKDENKDVELLTENLFGKNFQPLYWSNESSVEYVLESYEFNLTRALVLCPFESIRFKFVDNQLRIRIMFCDIKKNEHKRSWLFFVFVNFVLSLGYVAWTNNLLSLSALASLST